MLDDVAVSRFNEPNKGKFNHKRSKYRWTAREMREAANVLALKEVYDLQGQRDDFREKQLLKFAADKNEYREISRIIQIARRDAVERAKEDPEWSHEEPPKIETEEEQRSRKKRLKYVPIGIFAFIAVVVIGMLAIQEGNDYAFSIETVGRESEAESVTFTSRTGEVVELRHDKFEIAQRGTIAENIQLGSVNDVYSVSATANGTISCSITDLSTGDVLVSATGEDTVTCTLDG